MNYREIQDDAIRRYNITINTNSDCWSRVHAHQRTRTVCKWKPANSVQSTFTLLHEIGHIVTNHAWMRRAEQEFYATQWAIDRCEEYGIKLPQKIIDDYQEYIDMEVDRGRRRGGKDYGDMKLRKGADDGKV